jgi:hypothetical protein
MKFHIDAKHPEQGEKQFFCDLCGKGFIYEETHKQHSRFQANIFWLFDCIRDIQHKILFH